VYNGEEYWRHIEEESEAETIALKQQIVELKQAMSELQQDEIVDLKQERNEL